MKVALIWPPGVDIKTNFAGMSSMPLGILYLAAYLRERNVPLQLIDSIGLAPDKINTFKGDYVTIGLTPKETVGLIEKDAKLIGISATATVSHNVVLEIIKEAKKSFPDAKIVIGGNHASFVYEEFLKNGADYVVISEGGDSTLRPYPTSGGEKEHQRDRRDSMEGKRKSPDEPEKKLHREP